MVIPKMESSSVFFATSLDEIIRQEVNMPIDSSAFQTDSTQCIGNKDKRFQIFVTNCISAILDQPAGT